MVCSIRNKKSQSAMEYLMTYGWAILIIAVVLGALFQLGVFNASTFAPRAPPGACQVFRPNGPETATYINLEGVCSGELPQYVGVFATNTASGSQGGVQSHVITPSITNLITGSFTFTAWLYLLQGCQRDQGIAGYICIQGNACGGFYSPASWYNCGLGVGSTCAFQWPAGTCVGVPDQYSGSWVFYAASYNSQTGYAYISFNNQVYDSNTIATGINTGGNGDFGIGYVYDEGAGGGPFVGDMANLQLYNASLSGPEVGALYDEGIGGAPVNLQYLVGWWPLNGNANDYSGNNNNGVPNSVTYTSQWTSYYTPP